METTEWSQAISKITAFCSKSEHCSYEVREKLRQWDMSEDTQEKILQYLREEKYIDDARYCRAFIKDKIRFNGWGRRKIEQALYAKHIPREISIPIFEEIEDGEYTELLIPLLKAKAKNTKARNESEKALKLIRFALGRGYSYNLIQKCLKDCSISLLPDIVQPAEED